MIDWTYSASEPDETLIADLPAFRTDTAASVSFTFDVKALDEGALREVFGIEKPSGERALLVDVRDEWPRPSPPTFEPLPRRPWLRAAERRRRAARLDAYAREYASWLAAEPDEDGVRRRPLRFYFPRAVIEVA